VGIPPLVYDLLPLLGWCAFEILSGVFLNRLLGEVQPGGMLSLDPLMFPSRGRAVSPLYVPVSVFPDLCSCPLDHVDVEMRIA
jgi:hypothetical protein